MVVVADGVMVPLLDIGTTADMEDFIGLLGALWHDANGGLNDEDDDEDKDGTGAPESD